MEEIIYAYLNDLPAQLAEATKQARAHQQTLTKPPGSLGELEKIAIFLAGWQETPRADNIQVIIFAGNHGVVRHGVSPYPQAVTAQMVNNFEQGGAAINALASCFNLSLKVIPLDLATPTADFTQEPAMSEVKFLGAFEQGMAALDQNTDIVALGEMGIGNTTIASALCTAILGGKALDWVGPGTGLDQGGINHKAKIIERALDFHSSSLDDPLAIARILGGRETAALAGAALAARKLRIPVLVDGFVVTAALLPFFTITAKFIDHCLAAHCSAEPAHARLLTAMGLKPLLNLGMRLGEASGAAVASGIVRAAISTHRQMATFEQAEVTDRD